MTTPAPIRLRCNDHEDPLGLLDHPTFSWWVSDDRPAEVQSAYEIEVASSRERLDQDQADLWRSGRIEGSDNAHIPYQGLPLASAQQAFWRVRTYDSDALVSGWSKTAVFEMGLLLAEEWQGQWITTPLKGDRFSGSPAVALRRDFDLTFAPVRARVYLSVLGVERLYVNGRYVGGGDVDWVIHGAERPARVFDIAHFLTTGRNTVGLVLTAGIYAGQVANLGREIFGESPLFCLRLTAESEQGHELNVLSDSNWSWRPGEVKATEPNAGDSIDLRSRDEDWFVPQAMLNGAGQVLVVEEPAGAMVAMLGDANEPASRFPRQNPSRKPLKKTGNVTRLATTYEFSEHVCGHVRLVTTGKEVDDVEVRYSLDGKQYTTRDRFTTAGTGEPEVLEAQFARHNFSVVVVEYSVRSTLIDGVEAIQDTADIGFDIRSDHDMLNRLALVLNAGLRAVCRQAPMRGMQPQQQVADLGYAQCWAPTLARHVGASALVQKYLQDARHGLANPLGHSAYSTGRLPFSGDEDDTARFVAMTELAWSAYRYLGKRTLMADLFPELRAQALGFRHKYPELKCALPRVDVYGPGATGELLATLAVGAAVRRCGVMAQILDQPVDAERLSGLAEEIRAACRARFLTGDGHLVDESPSALLGALHWRLLEDNEAKVARMQLIEQIRAARYVVDLVPAVVSALLPELTAGGRLDMAYMVLLQTSPGSWMGQLHDGAKLIGRNDEPDPAFCGLLNWLIESVIGVSIDDELDGEQLGYQRVRIAPKPPLGAQFQAGSPVQSVRADLPTLFGVLHIEWQIQSERFELRVVLPPSCTADVELPDGFCQRVQSGRHEFVMAFSRGDDGVPTLLETAALPNRLVR